MKKLLITLMIALLCAANTYCQTVIQMEKKSGVYLVPCTVNGLRLNFIFDTGASDVTISLSEALFMLKNGYMNEADLIGTNYYQMANGEVAEGTKIVIRTLEIGGVILSNVDASIVHNLDAPLLLGQSALERFGKLTVDYSANTLSLGASSFNVNGSTVNRYIDEINLALEKGELANAEKLISSAKTKFPKYKAHFAFFDEQLAILAAQSGSVDLIMKYVSPLVENGTALAWAYQVVADVYRKKNDLNKVKEIIGKGKERYPNDVEIYIAEINLAFETGDPDKAGSLIETAKTKFPDQKSNFILLEVNFHLTKGNNEAAIKALDEAIATHKDKPEVLKLLYFNSGVIFSQMFTEAEESFPKDTAKMREYNNKMFKYYSKTVEVDPKYHPAYNGIANYYITNGNNYLLQADAIPLNMENQYQALKALGMEEYKKAVVALEKAWAISKEASYKNVLLALYQKTGQLDKLSNLQKQN